jgi:hypothetical protein
MKESFDRRLAQIMNRHPPELRDEIVSISEGIESKGIKKHLRSIKYEMKKLKAKVKSMDVSVSTPGVDPSVLQALRDEIAAAKFAADKAEGAASKSVPLVVPVGVSISEGIDSESEKSEERPVIPDSESETGLEILVTEGSTLTKT